MTTTIASNQMTAAELAFAIAATYKYIDGSTASKMLNALINLIGTDEANAAIAAAAKIIAANQF
jgi:hypothetical protein